MAGVYAEHGETTLENYTEQAIFFEAPSGPVSQRVFSQADQFKLLRLVHSSLGIANEVGELAEAILSLESVPDPREGQHELLVVKEELGDLCWYAAVGLDAIGRTFEDAFRNICVPEDMGADERDDQLADYWLKVGAGNVAKYVKKAVFYGATDGLDSNLALAYASVVRAVESVCFECGLSIIDDVLTLNIRKLNERYKGKFSEEAAVRRDKTAEYEAMRESESEK